MGGFSQGFQQGVGAADRHSERANNLQDEQRGLQEQAVWNDPDMSPQQKAQKIDVLFAHEPVESRMGRIGRGLQRITGQGKKADAGQRAADTKLQEQRDNLYGVPPAPTQGQPAPQSGESSVNPSLPTNGPTFVPPQGQPDPRSDVEGQPAPRAQLPQPNPGYRNKNEAIAGSLSKKTPQQQAQAAAEAMRGNIAPDLQANVDAIGTVLKRAGVDPAIIKEAQAIAGGAPAGAFKPESANWGNSQDIKLADGKKVSAQKNSRTGEWAYLSGEPIPKNLLSGATAVRTPHPLSPASQYANLMAKKLLADRKQGPPMTNEDMAQLAGVRGALTLGGISTANARADAMARNGLVVTTDPDTGMEVETQRSQAVAASRHGRPMTAGAVGAPTTQDKENQMYAVSSLHRLREMRNIVKSHPEVFGPIGGRTMNASVWLGSQSPEAQKFKQDAQFLAEHSTAVFGGRAASTVEALQKIQSDPKTNPEALLAGFDTDEDTLNDFTTGGGRLPAPRPQAGAAQKFVDGRKQYQIPSAKVEAFKKAHPNAKPE